MLKCRFAILSGLALTLGCYALAQQGNDPSRWQWNVPTGAPRVPGLEHGSFLSKAMNVEVGYNLYLPPGYANGNARYPVVYYLHGMTGNESTGANFAPYVHRAIMEKLAPPMIYVFVNGGAASQYFDWVNGRVMAETMIIKELIPHIDARYRSISSREGRGLAGFSMGGGGAVRLALKYPELFCCAASFAGAIGYTAGVQPKDGVAANDPQKLATANLEKLNGRVGLLMYVGDQDLTRPLHGPFVDHLKSLNVAHTYEVLPGVSHNPGQYYAKAGDTFQFQAKWFKNARP